MTKIVAFEDALVWQKAQALAKAIYSELRNCRDFGFKDQIFRASVSISNNIAEGLERASNKELKQFLFIAKGSCGEVRSMLFLARELGYINESDFNETYNLSVQVSKQLSAFIKTLQ